MNKMTNARKMAIKTMNEMERVWPGRYTSAKEIISTNTEIYNYSIKIGDIKVDFYNRAGNMVGTLQLLLELCKFVAGPEGNQGTIRVLNAENVRVIEQNARLLEEAELWKARYEQAVEVINSGAKWLNDAADALDRAAACNPPKATKPDVPTPNGPINRKE